MTATTSPQEIETKAADNFIVTGSLKAEQPKEADTDQPTRAIIELSNPGQPKDAWEVEITAVKNVLKVHIRQPKTGKEYSRTITFTDSMKNTRHTSGFTKKIPLLAICSRWNNESWIGQPGIS